MTDRKAHWEKVYTNNLAQQVSWYQEEPTLSLDLIRSIGLARDAPIIDVGGGASTLVDHLCEEGYTGVGILDVSAQALGLARDRLAERANTVEWYEADITTFEPPHRFSLWHDRAVFHFLTNPDDRDKYRCVLNKALEPGGHLVIMVFGLGGPRKCSGLDIVQYDTDKITTELGPGFDLLKTGHETHFTPSGNEQKFAFFHFRKSG